MTDDIVIVGAGIAGLATAVALEQRGHSVRVLERDAEPTTEGSAIGIWANGLAALERLGLRDDVVGLGSPIGDNTVHDESGRVIQRSPYTAMTERFGTVGVVLRRSDLRDTLAAAVKSPVEWGCQVSAVSQDDGAVEIRTESGQRLSARVVLGCDGVSSAVRQAVFGSTGYPRRQGLAGWRGLVGPDELDDPVRATGEWWGRGVAFGTHRFGDGAFWYGISQMSPEQRSAPEDRTGPTARAAAIAAFTGIPDVARSLIERTAPERVRWDEIFCSEALSRSGVGNVTLLGDAAHVPSPAIGQGACLSLEDGVVAAACIERWGPTAGALRQYERRRRRRVRQVVRTGRLWEAVKVGRAPVSTVARMVVPWVPTSLTVRAMARVWDVTACDLV